jgi:hypothetical protein
VTPASADEIVLAEIPSPAARALKRVSQLLNPPGSLPQSAASTGAGRIANSRAIRTKGERALAIGRCRMSLEFFLG